jgi:hypothetical protein
MGGALSAENRTCVGCQHWTFDPGCSAWSDVTPGDTWASGCDKGHWFVSGLDVTREKYRSGLQSAKTCPDYHEEAKIVPQSEIIPRSSPPLFGVTDEDES